MTDDDKCIPWYYPQLDPDMRMCSPFEAREFKSRIDVMTLDSCHVRPGNGYLYIGMYTQTVHHYVQIAELFITLAICTQHGYLYTVYDIFIVQLYTAWFKGQRFESRMGQPLLPLKLSKVEPG